MLFCFGLRLDVRRAAAKLLLMVDGCGNGLARDAPVATKVDDGPGAGGQKNAGAQDGRLRKCGNHGVLVHAHHGARGAARAQSW